MARDASDPLRGVAIRSLPKGDGRYLALLADALQDPRLDPRREAIQQLAWIRDPGTLPLLQRVILHAGRPSWPVRCCRNQTKTSAGCGLSMFMIRNMS